MSSGERWLGILGGGQLGRYLVLAARERGVKTFVVDPSSESPAFREADGFRTAGYDDPVALAAMAQVCGIVTWETESVPLRALERLEALGCRCLPGRRSLTTCQDRILEKSFLAELGIGTAPWAPLTRQEDLEAARSLAAQGAILKTAREGYDGKGQVRLAPGEDPARAWDSLDRVPCVLEGIVAFRREVSVLVARDRQGGIAVHPPIENIHTKGVLDVSRSPAGLDAQSLKRFEAVACRIAKELGHVGILAVEFFEGPDGQPLVNELAPRPHNSGHVTLGTEVSQFDQHVRCVLGEEVLPFATPEGSAIANLMGALWAEGEPCWERIGEAEGVQLELYGKRPREGRKMGHLAFRAESAPRALEMAAAWRVRLKS